MRKILNKRLYIVAGKGGVGKSTVSAALAKAVAATGFVTRHARLEVQGQCAACAASATPD